jgi:hypothetical protein
VLNGRGAYGQQVLRLRLQLRKQEIESGGIGRRRDREGEREIPAAFREAPGSRVYFRNPQNGTMTESWHVPSPVTTSTDEFRATPAHTLLSDHTRSSNSSRRVDL